MLLSRKGIADNHERVYRGAESIAVTQMSRSEYIADWSPGECLKQFTWCTCPPNGNHIGPVQLAREKRYLCMLCNLHSFLRSWK